ncbi:MAG: type II CAAX prenyl endopeptidase Rce1 family protein [Candidatus Hermodarchaeota archaeon]
MLDNNNRVKEKIDNIISSYGIILLFFLFWFVYSTRILIINIVVISTYFVIIIGVLIKKKHRKIADLKSNALASNLLLFIIPSIFVLDMIFFFIPNVDPLLFSFFELIGLQHRFEIIIFLPLLIIISLKIFGIYIYFIRNPGILEMGKGDEFFQYFANDLNKEKIISVALLLPLSSFVEELIYRSLVLSVLIYYFNFNILMGVMMSSFLFIFVHTVALKNTGQMISLLISSLVYFVALISLGILFSWFFHLTTNLFVLLFYYQRKKKDLKYEN